MHRYWRGGLGLVTGALFMQGCIALDWDFQSTPGAGGGPPTEDCTNGIDDDNDGRIDCVDSDCTAGFECNVAVPAGWTPYWLLEKPWLDVSMTVCPDGKDATVLFTEPATTTTCSQCDCSFTGATCTAPPFACAFGNPDCSPLSTAPYKSNGTPACYVLPVPGGSSYGSCKLTGPPTPINLGTCGGAPSTVMGPPKFGGELRLCASPTESGSGCSGGDVCVEKKPGTFGQGRACIEQAGMTQCPDGWGAKQFVGYEYGNDKRECANCTCDTSTVTCSGGDVTVNFQNNCAWKVAKLTDPNQCAAQILFESVSGISAAFTLGTPNPGTCTQAVASGVVEATAPHTICCRD